MPLCRMFSLQHSACSTAAPCSPVLPLHQPPTLLPTAWWDSLSLTSQLWWLSSRSSRSSFSKEKVNSKSRAQVWNNGCRILEKHSSGFVHLPQLPQNTVHSILQTLQLIKQAFSFPPTLISCFHSRVRVEMYLDF